MAKVLISNPQDFKIDPSSIKKAVLQVLQKNQIKAQVLVEVAFVDEETMHQLNRQYRGKDSLTDVLSFSLGSALVPDKKIHLGEVVICYPVAQKQAKKQGHQLKKELDFLTKHGVNHLIGNHHD